MSLSLYVLGHNYNLSTMRRYIIGTFVIAIGIIHTHRYTHKLVTIYMTFVTKAIKIGEILHYGLDRGSIKEMMLPVSFDVSPCPLLGSPVCYDALLPPGVVGTERP